MAQTPIKSQPWKGAPKLQIVGLPEQATPGQVITAAVRSSDLDVGKARIVWEGVEQTPTFGQEVKITPQTSGKHWVEVEAQWPDGRRGFGSALYEVK